MTVPGKGGRPALVSNPHIAGKIVSMVANGSSQSEAARALGVSPSTACRVVREHEYEIEDMRREIQEIIAANVLNGIDEATRARLKDASDPTSRTGAQSYRAIVEGVGLLNRGVNVDIAVAASATLDLTSVRDYSTMPPEERRRRLSEARRVLGLE